jgi:hypothetical protein
VTLNSSPDISIPEPSSSTLSALRIFLASLLLSLAGVVRRRPFAADWQPSVPYCASKQRAVEMWNAFCSALILRRMKAGNFQTYLDAARHFNSSSPRAANLQTATRQFSNSCTQQVFVHLNYADLENRILMLVSDGSESMVRAAKNGLSLSGRLPSNRWLDIGPHRDTGEFVFASVSGKPLCRHALKAIVKRAHRRSRLRKHVSPHTLRHCFASHMLGGGANFRVVQELLGHADVNTTMIYTHVDFARLKAIHKLLGR